MGETLELHHVKKDHEKKDSELSKPSMNNRFIEI